MLTWLGGVEGQARAVGVRPEAVAIGRAPQSDGSWTRRAAVEAVLPTGAQWIVRLRADGSVLFALSADDPRLGSGRTVDIAVARGALHVFGADGWRIDSAAARAEVGTDA
jgi:hypothetical protein